MSDHNEDREDPTKMERMNNIRSILNLTSVDHQSPQMSRTIDLQQLLFSQLTQQIEQQQQQQHQQLQLQQLQQQQQRQRQQQQQPETPSPVLQIAGISDLESPANGGSNHHTPTSHRQPSRNSSLASTNGRNRTPVANDRNGSVNEPSEKKLIDLVTCKLCRGYLIDAITIDLCMHSFCRPCALGFMKDNHRCPECNLEIKDKRFLNRLKTDVTLQSIVYKLVPGLYEKEMARRRKFYAARPTPTPRYKSEMFGDIPPAKTIKPGDSMNISVTWSRDPPEDDPIRTFLLCRADTTMLILKKLIIAKFGLERPIKIYYGTTEIPFDLTALMDIAATFNWSPEHKVLALTFKEHDNSANGQDNKKLAQAAMTKFSTQTNPGRGP